MKQEEGENWAVLVSASRYWFNYRHSTNALIFYQKLRQNGFPDERIILMLGDDVAGNSRNRFPNQIYHSEELKQNLFSQGIQVDYKGRAVSKESFTNLLIGEYPEWLTLDKKLNSDSKSNVFVFLTGHGGDNFFKFQDFDEMTSTELASIFAQMHQRKRFGELLFVMDTCQAATMLSKLNVPNMIALSTSLKGQSSYSDVPNETVGLPLVDRFAKQMFGFFDGHLRDATTLKELVNHFEKNDILSTVSLEYPTKKTQKMALETKLSKFFTFSGSDSIKVEKVIVDWKSENISTFEFENVNSTFSFTVGIAFFVLFLVVLAKNKL